MPAPKPASSSARWPLAGLGLLALVGLASLLAFVFPRGNAPLLLAPGPGPSAAPPPRRAPVDPAARPRAGVSGKVLSPDRAPVSGATVCAFARAEQGLTTAQARAPRCARTDASGSYSLADLFAAAPFTLSASAEGFAPASFREADGRPVLRLGEGEQRSGLDVVLGAGGVKIAGRVDDATGGVVPGALVAERGLDRGGEPGGGGDEGEAAARAVATTDGKGEFSLWVAPGQVHLSATASGYAPSSATGPAPGHFFTLHLVPGSTLVGRAVVAGTDAPVAGAKIESIQVEGGGARVVARSDDDGRFKIEGLSPGRYRIEAAAEGREGYSKASITLGMGETSPEQIVELDPAYVVAGRVVDRATGAPCKGGRVTITDRKQDEFSEASIDADGWARMPSVIPGSYQVEVSCEGYVERSDFAQLTVTDRDLPPQTWPVDRGASLRVSVVDEQRKPVTRAQVLAFPTGGDGRNMARAIKPEADGAFLLTGMVPGGYNLSVRASDGARAESDVKVEARGEGRAEVVLPLSGGVEGVVEDEGQKPAANVQIVAMGPGRASARSLDDGTFVLTGLPSGEYTLAAGERRFRRSGRDEASAAREVKVTVTAPGRVKAKLVVPRRDGRIEGRVVDRHGQPVSDAFLEHAKAEAGMRGVPRWGGSGRAPVVTDTEGRFTLESLEPGEYNLRAQRRGGGEASVDHVSTGRRDVTLTLADGASIAGTLSSPKGPVERFELQVRDVKTSFHRSELFFHAKGAFSLGDLPAGTYQVMAETPEGAVAQEVTLADGEQKRDLRLALSMRGVVTGRLVDLESGAPLAGLRVNVGGATPLTLVRGGSTGDGLSGRDGSFTIEGVLGGAWSMSVDPADETSAGAVYPVSVPITVGEGGSTDLGSVKIPRRRVAPGERRGSVGIDVHLSFDGADGAPLTVIAVSGAAEEAGVKEGDVIVSVDGFDVSGKSRYLFAPLVSVAPGRSLSIGLARGNVTVVAR